MVVLHTWSCFWNFVSFLLSTVINCSLFRTETLHLPSISKLYESDGETLHYIDLLHKCSKFLSYQVWNQLEYKVHGSRFPAADHG